MAGYLSNLVARALGEGEIVQPRPVSRFEPLPGVEITSFVASETPEEGETSTTPDAPLAAPPIPFPPPLELPVPGAENLAPSQANPPVEPVSQPARPILSAPTPMAESPVILRPAHSEYRSRASEKHSRVEDYPETPHTSTLVSPLEDVRPRQTRVSERETPGAAVPAREARVREIVVERSLPPVETQVGEHRGPSRREANLQAVEHREPLNREANLHAVDMRPALQPPPVPDATGERPKPAAKMFPPRVQPFVEPPPVPRRSAQKTPEPAPSVHITIGRIEVRATTPPAPTPRKKSNKPAVMSLDEYLKGRANGGGR